MFDGFVFVVVPCLLGRDERRKKSSKARSEPLAREAVDEEVQRARSKDFLSL